MPEDRVDDRGNRRIDPTGIIGALGASVKDQTILFHHRVRCCKRFVCVCWARRRSRRVNPEGDCTSRFRRSDCIDPSSKSMEINSIPKDKIGRKTTSKQTQINLESPHVGARLGPQLKRRATQHAIGKAGTKR